MTTPIWQAPVNGARTRLNAVDSAGHVNQFLSDHPATTLGFGNLVVRPTNGDQGYFTHTAAPALAATDFAQAFTMSGTTIGRVTVPILPFGNGADLLVSLCPDSSGNPNLNAPIAQVKVPANVITTSVASTGLENATSVFQQAYNNTQYGTNFSPVVAWNSPAATVHGSPSFFTVVTSGNYSLLLGGFDSVGSVASAACFTVLYTGAGTVASPIPQPNLPQGTFQGYAATTADTVVYAGGTTSASASVSNVWAASWNPSTGVIGAWSSQVALPTTLTNGSAVSSGPYVYIVGGNTANTVASAVNTVYVSKITNSQVGSWTQTTPLPNSLSLPFVAVIGNWMVVAGGLDAGNIARAESYYAPILSDGSLGTWTKGPQMFQGIDSSVASWCLGVTTNSLILYAGVITGGTLGSYIQQLSVTTSGPAPAWNVIKADAPGTVAMSAFTDGNGLWYLMGYNTNNTVAQNLFQEGPELSVPLYATGLTNGTQYWVVFQEVESADATDFLGVGLNFSAYTVDAKVSNRHQNSWSTFFSGTSVPIKIYDNTASTPIIHMVEDLSTAVPGNATYQRWSTLSYGQNKMLNGSIEVTMQPNLALNQNPTFTSGTSPWTATNGTLTQSSAQVHGGFPFSGLLTPTGGFPTAFASTEQIPVVNTVFGNTEWMIATGWFFTPTTWATFNLNINWYDPNGAFISTTTGTTTSLTGATWVQVSTYGNVPASAAFATVVPTMGGSPAAANTLYISNTFLAQAPENVGTLTSIAQVNYQTNTLWPPVGITQLN